MRKDLFILDTRCHLNKTIAQAFTKEGYSGVHLAHGFHGVPDEILKEAEGNLISNAQRIH